MQGLDPQGGVVVDTLVHADDDLFLAFHGLLMAIGGFLDLLLGETLLNGLDHSAHGINFFEVSPSRLFQLTGLGFYEIGTSQRIGCVGNATFVGKDLLGAQSDSSRLLRG